MKAQPSETLMDNEEEWKEMSLQLDETQEQIHWVDAKLHLIAKVVMGLGAKNNVLEKAATGMIFDVPSLPRQMSKDH